MCKGYKFRCGSKDCRKGVEIITKECSAPETKSCTYNLKTTSGYCSRCRKGTKPGKAATVADKEDHEDPESRRSDHKSSSSSSSKGSTSQRPSSSSRPATGKRPPTSRDSLPNPKSKIRNYLDPSIELDEETRSKVDDCRHSKPSSNKPYKQEPRRHEKPPVKRSSNDGKVPRSSPSMRQDSGYDSSGTQSASSRNHSRKALCDISKRSAKQMSGPIPVQEFMPRDQSSVRNEDPYGERPNPQIPTTFLEGFGKDKRPMRGAPYDEPGDYDEPADPHYASNLTDSEAENQSEYEEEDEPPTRVGYSN